jgi:hypothetical protein
MSTPFEQYGQLLREHVSAIVEAELALDPARAERYAPFLAAGRVAPRVLGCQPALPERDPSPAALMPMWIVVDGRKASGAGTFIAFDPERQRFGVGRFEGHTAWYEGGSGSFLDLVAQLAGETTGDTG